MERFAKWFEWTKLSQAAVGARLGVHQTCVSLLCRGVNRADLRTAMAIETETADWPEGPIRASEWDRWKKPARPPKSKRRKRAARAA
jgi:hypothetical protein